MIAEVEQPDGTYVNMDLEPPEGCFFCDYCGDCLVCFHGDYCYDEQSFGRWVVYLDDPLNPNNPKNSLDKTSE